MRRSAGVCGGVSRDWQSRCPCRPLSGHCSTARPSWKIHRSSMAAPGSRALCRLLHRAGGRGARGDPALVSAVRCQHSQSTLLHPGYVPKTSLSEPPWPQIKLPDPRDEAIRHAEVVQRINNLIANGQFERLFAVIQFASRQWKVTNEDLILSHSNLDAACGDRIRLEKVLLVGSDDFTLIGKPLLGRDLVRIEATVIEKTDSCPKVHMVFWKRHSYQRKKIIVHPQTLLRINTIEIAPCLS